MLKDDNYIVPQVHSDVQECYGVLRVPQRLRGVTRERPVTALHEIYLKYGQSTSYIQKLSTDLVLLHC